MWFGFFALSEFEVLVAQRQEACVVEDDFMVDLGLGSCPSI